MKVRVRSLDGPSRQRILANCRVYFQGRPAIGRGVGVLNAGMLLLAAAGAAESALDLQSAATPHGLFTATLLAIVPGFTGDYDDFTAALAGQVAAAAAALDPAELQHPSLQAEGDPLGALRLAESSPPFAV